jgi:hypothetical protein
MCSIDLTGEEGFSGFGRRWISWLASLTTLSIDQNLRDAGLVRVSVAHINAHVSSEVCQDVGAEHPLPACLNCEACECLSDIIGHLHMVCERGPQFKKGAARDQNAAIHGGRDHPTWALL